MRCKSTHEHWGARQTPQDFLWQEVAEALKIPAPAARRPFEIPTHAWVVSHPSRTRGLLRLPDKGVAGHSEAPGRSPSRHRAGHCLYNEGIESNAAMNAPDKLLKISLAPGIYIIRPAPAKARSSRRRTAALLLTGLRRASQARGGKTGRKYLKEIRAARYARRALRS